MFGALFMVIQKQEQIIAFLFDKVELLLIFFITKGRSLAGKLKGKKGTKLYRLMSWIEGNKRDNLMEAQIITMHVGNKNMTFAQSSKPAQNATSIYQMQLDTKNTLYNREKMHMDMGNNMVTQYQSTLLFKLLSKSFTPNDTMMIKKILGRDTASALNIDDLNQVADFMFVKDTNGKVIGLTEVFLNMFNASSYTHK